VKKIFEQYVFLMVVIFPACSFSITIEIDVQENQIFYFTLLLNGPSNIEQRSILSEICDTLNSQYSTSLLAEPILNSNEIANDGIRIKISELDFLNNKLNFLDYNKKTSFFNEKYYLKIILNTDILKSSFFQNLPRADFIIDNWQGLTQKDAQINLIVNCPGKMLRTNMQKTNGYFLGQFEKEDFMDGKLYVLYESVRFLPHIYLTIFVVLIILFFLAVKLKGGLQYRQQC
jgi:hypothetical protein